jgi:hypothetical protein
MVRTAPRKWTLLTVMPIALLVALSDGESIEITFRRGPGKGRLWQCPDPTCLRVERVRLPRPSCSGPPEKGHDKTNAVPLPDDDKTPVTDKRPVFK